MIDKILGIVDKMRIEVFPNSNFKEGTSTKTLFVQLNPDKYSLKQNVIYCDDQPMGSSAGNLIFNKIEGEEVTFEFLFDSTGVVPLPSKESNAESSVPKKQQIVDTQSTFKPPVYQPTANPEGLNKLVDDFKKGLSGYNSSTHETKYLKIIWGSYILHCRLKSMDIEYTLFNRQGLPLRAKAKCTFKESVDFKLRLAIENAQSADITHEREAKMNDKLTLVAEDIYDSNRYYIDVAKANKLLTFRCMETSQRIKYPPIK